MMVNNNFKEFVLENLIKISHPTRPNKILELDELESLCDLFFCFLNFEIEESSLKRIKSNFENDFEKIYQLNKTEISSAIEGLATNLESFLKKIAYLKFDNEALWKGDKIYKGIEKSTLFELIEGKRYKIDSLSEGPNYIDFPSPIVCNSGIGKQYLILLEVN